LAQPVDDEARYHENGECDRHVSHVAEVREYVTPARPETVADQSKSRAPDGARRGGEGDEFPESHLADPRRNRDEGSNERDETAKEDDGLAATVDPCLGSIEISLGEQDVLADSLYERTTAELTNRVSNERTADLPNSRNEDDDDELQVMS